MRIIYYHLTGKAISNKIN